MPYICRECNEYFTSAESVTPGGRGKPSRCAKGHPVTKLVGWMNSGLVSFLIPLLGFWVFYFFSGQILFLVGYSRWATLGVAIFWICTSLAVAVVSVMEVRNAWRFDGYRRQYASALAARVWGAAIGLVLVAVAAYVRYVRPVDNHDMLLSPISFGDTCFSIQGTMGRVIEVDKNGKYTILEMKENGWSVEFDNSADVPKENDVIWVFGRTLPNQARTLTFVVQFRWP
jgi:preprotein translocase subunit YajC